MPSSPGSQKMLASMNRSSSEPAPQTMRAGSRPCSRPSANRTASRCHPGRPRACRPRPGTPPWPRARRQAASRSRRACGSCRQSPAPCSCPARRCRRRARRHAAADEATRSRRSSRCGPCLRQLETRRVRADEGDMRPHAPGRRRRRSADRRPRQRRRSRDAVGVGDPGDDVDRRVRPRSAGGTGELHGIEEHVVHRRLAHRLRHDVERQPAA